ncbi:MAG: hypothetical protein ABFD16_26910, partial [Thermoguttaceae bacterium]
MELDHHRITIRERTYVDVLDLALRVIREFAWPLATVFGLGVVPMMLFDGWLLSGYEEEGLDAGGPVQYGLLMILLIAFETPLATALTTLYLGRAMFSQRPRLREVLRDLLGALPQLVLYQILLRPLCFRWTYLNEV